MEIQDRLDQLTGIDSRQRSTIFRFMAGLSDHERGKAIAAALGKSHKYDKTHPDREKYGYVFIFEVELIKELKARSEIVRNGLRVSGTPERVKVLQDRRQGSLETIARERKKKKGTKRSLLQKNIPVIIEARMDGYSWETIAKYIGKQHGVKISRETVRKLVDAYTRKKVPGNFEKSSSAEGAIERHDG